VNTKRNQWKQKQCTAHIPRRKETARQRLRVRTNNMLLKEIVEKLSLQVVSGEIRLENDVVSGTVSDILSDVMAKAAKNSIWITNQTHENVIAIVFFKGLAGVILAGGLEPEKPALDKAREKGIPILLTPLSTFDIAGELYKLGIRGSK